MIYILIIIGYLILVTLVSLFTKKISSRSAADFLLAGRNLGILACTIVVAAEWLGGNSTIGVSEQAFKTGSLQPILYNISTSIGMILVGFLVAFHYRKNNVHTVSEMLEYLFGKQARLVTAIPFLIAYITLAFVQLQTIASGIGGVIKIDWIWTIIIGSVVITAYTYIGGMHAIALTNIIHLVIMITGIGSAFIVGIVKAGGFTAIKAATIAAGGAANPYNPFSVSISAAAELLIGGVLGGMAAQASIQPVFAARSPQIARKSALISSIIVAPFGIMTAFLGLIARGSYFSVESINPKIVLPTLLATKEFIHPLLGGLALAGIMAAILSTIAPINFAIVTIAINDVYKKLLKKEVSDQKLVKASKVMVLIVNLLLIPLAILFKGGILDMTYISYAIRAIGAVIILTALYRRNWINLLGLKLAFIGGTAAVFFFVIAKQLEWFSINKTYGSLVVAIIFIIIGRFFGKDNYQAEVRN